jgi:hypothetical protein
MDNKILQRAKKKYSENLRNYKHYKNEYENYYYNSIKKYSRNEIKDIEMKMNQSFDILETLVYIFGDVVRSEENG